MDEERLYFLIGNSLIDPITHEKRLRISQMKHPEYPAINELIYKAEKGKGLLDSRGYLKYYQRDFTKLNHHLSIILALLNIEPTMSAENIEKFVVKYYKRRSKYMSFYEENTTKIYRDKLLSKSLQKGNLRKELFYRGFIQSVTDTRYKEYKYYMVADLGNGQKAIHPISEPEKEKLKKLLYCKVKIKGITKIKSHGI